LGGRRRESLKGAGFSLPPVFTFGDAKVAQPKLLQIVNGTSVPSSVVPPNLSRCSLPVHVKKLPRRIDPVALAELDAIDEDVKIECLKLWNDYLLDPRLYAERLPRCSLRDIPVALIDPRHTLSLLEAGIVEFVSHDKVRATVRFFLVLEALKHRFRLISHAKVHNELMDDTENPVTFNSVKFRRQLVHFGDYALERDFMSYYYQGLMAEDVRDYFVARVPMPDGTFRLVRQCVAGMGQKHMVKVFCTTTDLVLSF